MCLAGIFCSARLYKIMRYKVKVDRELCIGAANCTAIASKTFVLDSEGKSVIKKRKGAVSSGFVNSEDIVDKEEVVMAAAKSCPTNAIVIIEVDENGREIRQIWPA